MRLVALVAIGVVLKSTVEDVKDVVELVARAVGGGSLVEIVVLNVLNGREKEVIEEVADEAAGKARLLVLVEPERVGGVVFCGMFSIDLGDVGRELDSRPLDIDGKESVVVRVDVDVESAGA